MTTRVSSASYADEVLSIGALECDFASGPMPDLLALAVKAKASQSAVAADRRGEHSYRRAY